MIQLVKEIKTGQMMKAFQWKGDFDEAQKACPGSFVIGSILAWLTAGGNMMGAKKGDWLVWHPIGDSVGLIRCQPGRFKEQFILE